MTRSVRIVGGALVLSALTTSFGFLTNMFSGTASLLTFGVLATVGIVAAFLYANVLFPAARVLLDRRAAAKDKLPASAFATSGRAGSTGRGRHRDHPAARAVGRGRRRGGRAGAGVVTATNLRSGFSFLDFVPEGSAVRTAAAELRGPLRRRPGRDHTGPRRG